MPKRGVGSIEIGFASRQGPHKSENEDSFGVLPRGPSKDGPPTPRLLVVADGMGGHRGGREASQMAVHHLEEQVFEAGPSDPVSALEGGVKAANQAIFERARRESALAGMGTTCTALLLQSDAAHVAHVGDSRAYRIRGKQIDQLTTDHSWVERMVQERQLSKEEAAHHEQRHVLHRAVGVLADVDVDHVGPVTLEDGDAFLLCSDGVHLVTEDRLLSAVRQHEPQDACDLILQWVADLEGYDDSTVIIAVIRV